LIVMEIRILDLDGSLLPQEELRERYRPQIIARPNWGPHIRLGCRFGRFGRFEESLRNLAEAGDDGGPKVTLYGSGDFHHVSLALIRQIKGPFNLLVIDNHPDWMRGVPFLHCGTWVYHAARLPQVQRIFHVGGDVDFDNYYRWMAPWKLLRSGKITVLPAFRAYQRGRWSTLPTKPVRPAPAQPIAAGRLKELLSPYQASLSQYPLYISLDKDVMVERDALVNWDSGHLTLAEVRLLLEGFLLQADGNLAGMDIVGDWSPVRLGGVLRRLLHWTEHPQLNIDPANAARLNQQTNLALLDTVQNALQRTLRATG
jgi:hypothetical protein